MKTTEKIINEVKYVLKLSRPRFWLYLAGPALLGLVLGAGNISQLYSVENILLFLYFLIPANIMLYGVNDYFDRDIDEENPKKEDKETSYRENLTTDLVVGLSASLLVPVTLMLPSEAYPAMIAFLLLSVFYSAPPLRFKAKPFLDSLSNGLYILPLAVSYTAVTQNFPPVTIFAAGWLWTMAMHTFSAIPDIVPDRKADIKTTATFLGRKNTYIYCTVIWSLSAIVAGLYNVFAGALMIFYPLLCAGFYFSNLEDSEAYWYYPYINAFIGMILTLTALWVLVHG